MKAARSCPAARSLLARVACCAAIGLPGAYGVEGTIPNQPYPAAEKLTAISPQLGNLHLNQPSVYNGYVVFAGNATHEVYDISNPYLPVRRATMKSRYTSLTRDAESHQVTYARRPDGTAYMATISGKGVDIWNVTDTTNPVPAGEIQLPGIDFGDVTGGIWGLSWQGNHLYAGATTYGLYVLDVADPSAPRHVATVSRAGLGNVPAGPVFALGSTLVVTTPKTFGGVATVDITDPLQPRLLDSVVASKSSYIGGFYGGNAHLIVPFRSFDVTTDPSNIREIGSFPTPNGEYLSFANNTLYFGGLRGGSHGIHKYDISNPATPVFLGRFVGRDSRWDDQFCCPIGNLMAVADDQRVDGSYVGGIIVVQDTEPELVPPAVMKVFPANGSTGQTLRTCVALSLTEWPELATVDTSSCIVRPVGGAALSGTWSTTCTLLSFGADAPLQPNTTYEVVLPAGGLKDLVGNGIATEFRSTFRTGAGALTGFPGNTLVAPVPPTELGQITDFALSSPPRPGDLHEWHFDHGSSKVGAAVSHTYAVPGRHPVRLDVTPRTPFVLQHEAEGATLSGGVVVGTGNAGYSGTGYADFPSTQGTGVAVQWTVTLDQPSFVQLSFRYANGGSANRPLHLVVNGGTPVSLAFPGGGTWANYLTQGTTAPVHLPAGPNSIVLRASAGAAGGNIDRLEVAFLEPAEAETADLEGAASIASAAAGFTGPGFVSFAAAGRIRWAFSSFGTPLPLSFRYANGGGANRPLQLVVDGGSPVTLPFQATGDWETWGVESSAVLNLAAGSHTAELVGSDGSPAPNIDSLLLPGQVGPPSGFSFTHVVHRPLTASPPSQSRPLALDATRSRLWVVNPDAGTVTCLDAADLSKLGEFPVGDRPENLAIAPDGRIWIVNQDSATITILQPDGTPLPGITLPRASQPFGLVFSADGNHAFVSLQALGRIVRLDAAGGAVLASLELPVDPDGIRPEPRGLALDASGKRLFATRFLSPDAGGQVFEIDALRFTLTRTLPLAADPGPDTANSSRGIPNYLSSIAISPDGTRAWLPSKKDNIFRGNLRDGNGLTHDQSVRSITSVLDLAANGELPAERIDYDNRDRAHAADFSTLGDLAFVTQTGNNQVEVIDTFAGTSVTRLAVGMAPTGILFDEVNERLFVLNFLSRSVSAFDVSALVSATGTAAPELAPPTALVARETLAPEVLLGKRLFYDASSTRLNEEGYMSCASCHLDGSHDGRVWDFTGFGEGLRNTTDLRGRAGTAHGRVHWTGNFDEIHDFEGQIRNFGAGFGLMETADFASGSRSGPLGDPKAGLSADLDALAAYVSSLARYPASPYRGQDGSLTPAGLAGREIFHRLSCFACHGGEHFTDSPLGVLHDVGTLKSSSGRRLGQPLEGLDTPTLRGIWATPPYLHDGSAATLEAVFTAANPHATARGLTPAEISQLAAYLRQLDGSDAPALPATGSGVPSFAKYLAAHSVAGGGNDHGDGDRLANLLEYALGATDPGSAASAFPPRDDFLPAGVAPGPLPNHRLTFLLRAGGFWEAGTYRSGDLAYRPRGSADLATWDLGPVPAANPPGLEPAPPGYEWTSFILPPDRMEGFRGFLRLDVELEAP